jgi:hypothetical protein
MNQEKKDQQPITIVEKHKEKEGTLWESTMHLKSR